MTTRGDRVLLWLTILTLFFGGVGTTVAVFLTDVVMVRAGAPHSPGHSEAMATSSVAEGEGIVVAVELKKSRLVVDHGEIKGFMGPMLMGYVISPTSLLEALKPGDKIRFKIDVDRKVIVGVQRLRN
jgi:Cu/Ag efflux protein CusF